uniref:Centrosomal protein 128 n=1 Tax=Cyprinodon variegatus TaxID=28743 RepID=A0A3Q2FJ21_CYPVA
MDTSSESDSYERRMRGNRGRGRESHRRSERDRSRDNAGGNLDLSDKISTLANTLQDTSRNLTKVDRMLGQYREHADDQAEAMTLVRHFSEQRFYPTSPLRDYSSSPGRRRRSQSAGVRFKDSNLAADNIHTVHQTLRDLRCDQQRLSDDLDREILRRNRYLLVLLNTAGYSQQNLLNAAFVSAKTVVVFFNPDLVISERGKNRQLEKEVAELRAQLNQAAARGEVEELKRLLDRKERENLRLNSQVKVTNMDSVDKLNHFFQSRGQTERREMEALLLESTRSRNELKSRAQEAVRQWRAKCRRLQQELEDARAQGRLQEDKAQKAQLKALSQQTEAARRELGEILRRLTQREEEIHRKDVELSETRQRQLLLQEASAVLEQEAQLQTSIQARLREEKQRLEEQADSQARRLQRDQDAKAELQAALKQMTDAHAHLSQRLSQEDNARKELQKDNSELQARLTLVQEERSALSQQLQLEREVHQKELENMKATMKDDRMKKDWEVQERLKLCQQERDEIKAQLREADAASDKELCAALNIKLDRMKDECDKLVAQLGTKDEAHSLLQRKYQQLKQDLEDKVSQALLGCERRRVSESELARLEKKVLTMEADQETVLTSLGEELDAVFISGLLNLSSYFSFFLCLSETNQIKLRWLCEEVQERDMKDRRLRKQHQQTRDQLKALRQSLDQQEKLLLSHSTEKKGSALLNKKKHPYDDFDRVLDLEMSTRVALEHLESLPEKKCLMEDFKDLEESQQQKEFVEQRYVKYREIVRDLQHQLDESKRRIQEYRVRHPQTHVYILVFKMHRLLFI